MTNIRAALFISLLTRYGTTGLNIVSVIVLSRLLTPDDIGIYSIGAAVISFAHMLRDFGVPSYVVQEKNLTLDKLRSASGLAIIVGWSMALLLFLFAESLASYYEEPGIEGVLNILAVNFMLIPIGVVSPSLLQRNMEFKKLFNIHISGTFVTVSSSIILAYAGLGYMAMAWGSLCGIATTMMISLYYLPPEYRAFPGLNEWRGILNFGSYNTINLLMTGGGKSGTELAIGKLTDFATLGLFSRAYGYMDIFRRLALGAILPVVYAVLSKERRAGKPMGEPYLLVFSMILGVGIPGYFFLAAMSAPLILMLYGDQWTGAATTASLICLSAVPALITVINKQILLSIGRVKALAVISIIVQPLKILLVIFLAKNGLETIAMALIATELLHAAISQYYTNKVIEIDNKAWWKNLATGIFIGLLSSAAPLFLLLFCTDLQVALQVTIGTLGGGIGWLMGIKLTNHPLNKEVNLLKGKATSFLFSKIGNRDKG